MPPRKDFFLLKKISDEKFPRSKTKLWFFNFEKYFEMKIIEKSKGRYGYENQEGYEAQLKTITVRFLSKDLQRIDLIYNNNPAGDQEQVAREVKRGHYFREIIVFYLTSVEKMTEEKTLKF